LPVASHKSLVVSREPSPRFPAKDPRLTFDDLRLVTRDYLFLVVS
jgi:hypothetical protein